MSALRPVGGAPREVVVALRGWLSARTEPPPLVVETSGSSGPPKRVLLARRAVLASTQASARRLGGEGRWVLALPASYVAGIQVIVRSLTAGHEPVVRDEHATWGDLVRAAAGGRGAGGGVPLYTSMVPTQLHRALSEPADVASLRAFESILVGGGPFPAELRGRALAAGLRPVATYGATETAGGCVYDGVPLDGVAVALDAHGRIRIAGPTLFDGYDGDPQLTARTLVDGWYLTSDAGRLDEDCRLEVLGRLDQVVVSGGVNVPTSRVAARLREHPAVRQAEVVGVADPEWGHRVVAYVVPAGAGGPTLAAARDFVAARLPRAWAPRQLVEVTELPLLPTGKVDRVRLERT